MTILKLQNEGDTHTGIVTSCGAVQGQYGEQVEFVFQSGDKLFLPKESADRQLDRLTLDYEGAVGQSLTFSRDHNPKKGAKPYWGISYGTKAASAAPAPSRRIPPPSGAPPQAVTRGSLPFDDDPGPQDPDEPLYREPAQTPREQREATTGVSDRERNYLACYERVATELVRICRARQIPLDASACNAVTFSIFGGQR